MKSRLPAGLIVVAGLAVTGTALQPLVRREEPATAPGGVRAVAADFAWLQTNVEWERREAARTQAWLDTVVRLDPRRLYFWLNGARMIAYDFPVWRSIKEKESGRAGEDRLNRIRTEEALRALAFLDRARPWHAHAAAWWVERANIELNGLHDPVGAGENYRHASEQPDAPYYAPRLYAEMLCRTGRKREALAWLVRLHPQLPPHDELAGADEVLARIRKLERTLGVPAANAYVPPAKAPEAGR